MDFPNDMNKQKTEEIMERIKEEIYNGEMEVSDYNKTYMIVYDVLNRPTIENIVSSLKMHKPIWK